GSHAVAGLRQPLRLAGLAYGPADPLQWSVRERAVDFFDVKGDLAPVVCEMARLAGREPNEVKHLDLTDPDRSVGWNPLGTDPSDEDILDVAY
ncbi:MAG: hypothetical protein ACO3UM_15980, partial [Planctomycetota bacterium]